MWHTWAWLSKMEHVQADPWQRIVEAEQKGEVLEVLIKSFNKGTQAMPAARFDFIQLFSSHLCI